MKRLGVIFMAGLFLILSPLGVVHSAENLNAYSIWPENWARPMFEGFEKATGSMSTSSGSLRARL